MIRRTQNRGFIALISAIIITTVLITFVVSVGASGFFSRFDILSAEIKEKSQSIAEGCVHTAILRRSQDNGYVGGEEIMIDGNPCEIVSVTATEAKVHVNYNDSYTNLKAGFDSDFNIVTWEEVANKADL
jgi:hypothetical protein